LKFLTTLILMMMLAAGCNVEEGSGGSLIAGHVPVENKFEITLPTNASYDNGAHLDFYLTFPYPVTVVGSPRLVLTVGSSTRYATYLSGENTTELVFRYTVSSGENDSNGIQVSSTIDLNGGFLTFVGTAGADDCSTSLTVPSTSGIKVDTSSPTITSVTGPSNRTYYKDMIQSYTLVASEAIIVSGTPRIPVIIGSTTRYADYVSGSGTNTLVFQYVVADGDYDTNGVTVTSPVQLNGGILRDAASNPLILTFTPPSTTNVLVDGEKPYVKSITPPSPGVYTYGQSINFSFYFSETVSVSGTPTVNVTVGSTVRQASYLSGSGTRTLSFRYVVQGNDVDTNGIQLGTSFNLASSAIQDVDSIDALPTFIAPNTPGVKVTAPAPRVTGFNFTNGNYKLGQQINVVAIFNEAVTITGNPRLKLNIGGTTRYANYQSGSGSTNIIFRYIVAAGDLDTNGIVITSPLDLASGDIVNSSSVTTATSFTNPSTPSVRVDGIIPTVSSISVTNDNYSTGEFLDITVNFSETVTATATSSLKLDLNIGGVTRQASYNAGSGSSAIVFRYTVTGADADADGIAILSPINVSGAASLADAYGNVADYIFTPPATPLVFVNSGVPVVTTITSPANDVYKEGESIDFILNFSEAVDVTGSPRIAITVGSTARYATYALGSGGMNLTFRYTVPSGDLDTNGIAATTVIDLDGGTIQNAGNTNASLTIPSQTLTGVLVDAVAPTITNVSKPADGTYVSGQQLDFTATFSEAVYLTNSPRIAIDIGGVTRYALATSGSGSTSIVFRYTVQAADEDADGIVLSSPVDLNSGAIADAAGNNSSLTFTVPTTTGVLVDGNSPTIDQVTPPADGNYVAGATWDFVLTMSEAATVTGNPQIAITVGSTTRYAVYDSGGGTSTLTFKYTTQSGDDDGNGIELVSPLQLAGGSIESTAFGTPFSLNFTSPNTSNIRVDTTAPTIASISAPSADTYGTGEALNFTVNFSEAVDVAGVPSLELTIGSTTRLATYQSGSGSTALLFRYTVVSGEVDTDGISVVSPLQLTGGSTIKDGFTNNATLTFTPPTTTTVLVDSQNPTITSVTGPASGSYKAGLNLNFTVNFSEDVIVTNLPTIPVTIGATPVVATYVSGSGSSSLTFSYTVVSPNTDTDGIASASPVSVSGAAIRDSNNNNAVLTFTPPDTTAVLVDTTAPSISSVTGPTAATYLTGNSLSFTVTFTENVN